MNIRTLFKITLLLIVCLMVTAHAALADGIKERMRDRLPAIADLKAKGIIGEDNSGYLGYVTQTRVQEDVIAAENKDRNAIYAHFAKQQNTTLQLVEKIQAQRKAEKALPGEFFQHPDGSWHKK
ncbi:YdbL family protein [Desulfobacula sp.]|uniref:YdbL family protein n=1 Tax=Desulfobacula sp. TaxID=2593537 RepID=UPI00260F1F06|nr:YdbL family protein [Desulfobacula sp.]